MEDKRLDESRFSLDLVVFAGPLSKDLALGPVQCEKFAKVASASLKPFWMRLVV